MASLWTLVLGLSSSITSSRTYYCCRDTLLAQNRPWPSAKQPRSHEAAALGTPISYHVTGGAHREGKQASPIHASSVSLGRSSDWSCRSSAKRQSCGLISQVETGGMPQLHRTSAASTFNDRPPSTGTGCGLKGCGRAIPGMSRQQLS